MWTTAVGPYDSPPENPSKKYVPFGLVQAEPNYPIVYKADEETLLFTFEGDGTCSGEMYLIDCGTPNQSAPFCPPNSQTSNPDNDISVIDFEPTIEQPSFQFAPNPADEIVNIRFSAIEKDAVAFLRLVNVQGQVLQKQPLINTNQLRLDLTPYTSDMYFLLLEVDGEIWQEGKLVKR